MSDLILAVSAISGMIIAAIGEYIPQWNDLPSKTKSLIAFVIPLLLGIAILFMHFSGVNINAFLSPLLGFPVVVDPSGSAVLIDAILAFVGFFIGSQVGHGWTKKYMS
jgi:hypothetical protein